MNEDRAVQRASAEFACGYCDPDLHALSDATGMTETDMGELVNLKQFRKRAERELAEKEAAANRARFGRTRSERASEEQREHRAKELLDQHRIDGGDDAS